MGTVTSLAEFRAAVEDGEIAARELERHARAGETHRAYTHQQKMYKAWLKRQRTPAREATPDHVRRYLATLDERGYAASTVVVAAAAIKALYDELEMVSPTMHPKVRGVMRGIQRRPSAPPKQAKGLTGKDMVKLREWAHGPVRDMKFQSAETQRQIRLTTLALIGTMRDSMLRRSEAAAIEWDDIEMAEDGSGSLRIRRGKTDQSGKGAYGYLSRQTMEDLTEMRAWQRIRKADRRVFRLSPGAIGYRMRTHCKAAGLEGDYSGHSCRVGAAQDLARINTPDYAIQQAGRWSSPAMPAKYTRNIRVHDNAMARWHAMQEEEG